MSDTAEKIENIRKTLSDKQRESLYAEVKAVIEALPQRNVIADSTVDNWINGIIDRDPDRAVWHAHRAAGIGGSEVGELLLTSMGERNAYNTLEELSQSKLLLRLPDFANIHMRRGTEMEPLAEEVFHGISRYKAIGDTPEIREMFSKPHPKYPFLVGNPDDVSEVGGKRIITDFKVRSNLDAEEAFKLINVSQLHWYGLLHEGHTGNVPDYYGLAELDIPTVLIDDLMSKPAEDRDLASLAKNISSVNAPGFGMQIRTFRHNASIGRTLIRLAEKFWNEHVLSGKPYQEARPTKPANMKEVDERRLQKLQADFLKYKLASMASKDKADEIKEEIEKIAGRYEMDDWPFETPGVTAGYSTKFDVKAAGVALMAKGIEKSAITRPGEHIDQEAAVETLRNNGLLTPAIMKDEWDTRKIKAKLKEADIGVEKFEKTSFRLGMSTKRKDVEVKEVLQSEMTKHIRTFKDDTAPADRPANTQKQADIDLFQQCDDTDDQEQGISLA